MKVSRVITKVKSSQAFSMVAALADYPGRKGQT